MGDVRPQVAAARDSLPDASVPAEARDQTVEREAAEVCAAVEAERQRRIGAADLGQGAGHGRRQARTPCDGALGQSVADRDGVD